MKIKVVKSSSSGYWYSDRIGEIFDVEGEDTTDYKVFDTKDGLTGYIRVKDAEIVKDEPVKPRLFEHEGKKYILPEWAKFVTRDRQNELIWAWENKPDFCIKGFYVSKGKREPIESYVEPLPEGAFIVEVK